jgi:hypothetical protein
MSEITGNKGHYYPLKEQGTYQKDYFIAQLAPTQLFLTSTCTS